MKYTLATELSTATPSVALLGDNRLLGSTSWRVSRGTPERMFSAIDELLNENNIKPADISLFGVGLGPGNFTGLRTSLSTIQALALPTHTDIIGISSAEAIAYKQTCQTNCRSRSVSGISSPEVSLTHNASPGETSTLIASQHTSTPQTPRILVAGDARRRRLWLGIFETSQNSLQQTGKFELVPMDDFAGKIQPGDTIITPDWQSLEFELSAIVPDTATLIMESQIPTATTIATLANQRKADNTPCEPLKPIYMHPPVFIEPRFTEATKRKI